MKDRRIIALPIALSLGLLMAGCTSKYEAYCRIKDIEAKANHKGTYRPLTVRGPMTLGQGAELGLEVPNMPYRHTPIPDGAATQAGLIKSLAGMAAILGLGLYGIHGAGNSTSTANSHNTTTTGGCQ